MMRGLRQEAKMPRKAHVQRSAEEKFAIVLEGLKSGNIAETCRNHQIAATRPDEEQAKRIKQLERALGRSQQQIENLKNVLGE
jgi:transposase-like protein